MKYLVSSALLALFALNAPHSALAQTSSGQLDGSNLGNFLGSIIDFINSFVIPFIWALAFIVFIWGVFQYFIMGGANEEKREEGKKLVVWGIIAFFVMSSIWGIVNLFTGTFQFGNDNGTKPVFLGMGLERKPHIQRKALGGGVTHQRDPLVPYP